MYNQEPFQALYSLVIHACGLLDVSYNGPRARILVMQCVDPLPLSEASHESRIFLSGRPEHNSCTGK